MMATLWLTGAGVVRHMRCRWTVEAAQEREITMVLVATGKRNAVLKQTTVHIVANYELRTTNCDLRTLCSKS
jgi:hypothetical protein